jgi:hypothetical protein
MALSLSETRHNFELFVREDLLQNHLEKGTLSAIDSQGESYRLVPEDIQVRLNNWYKVKSSRLHPAVLAAFLSGMSVMALFVGVIQLVAEKKKTENKRL